MLHPLSIQDLIKNFSLLNTNTMLAASEPQDFIPYGRLLLSTEFDSVLAEHMIPIPDSLSTCLNDDLSYEDVYSKNISNRKLKADTIEKWTIRRNSEGSEEELYAKGRSVVWSVGNFSGGCNVAEESNLPVERNVKCRYLSEYHVRYAFWANFKKSLRSKCGKNEEPSNEALCIFDDKQLSIYLEGSDDFVTGLPFQVRSAWPIKDGILVERVTSVSASKSYKKLSSRDYTQLPSLFSLSHPLDEFSPFLMLRPGGLLSFYKEQSSKVVFTCSEPSVCLIYDYNTGSHILWKVRKSTVEEKRAMCVTFQDSANNTSRQISSSILTIQSASQQSIPLSRSSINNLLASTSVSSPTYNSWSASGTTSVAHNNSPFSNTSSKISPLASFNCLHNPSGVSNSLQSTLSGARFGKVPNSIQSPKYSSSPKNSPTLDARLGMSPAQGIFTPPKPLVPDLCLEYLWSDSFTNKSQQDCVASRAFLSTDFAGQQFLCYVVPSRKKVFCASFRHQPKLNSFVFGSIVSFDARDADYLPDINAMVVVAWNGSVSLYSGVTFLRQVMFGGISSSQNLDTTQLNLDSILEIDQAPQISNARSPKCVSQSSTSLLSSTRMGDEIFDDHFFHLSPVIGNADAMETSSNNTPRPQLIQATVGSQVIFKYTDESFHRVIFPEVHTSSLVKSCMKALKSALPGSLMLDLCVKWYMARNSPGTQDISCEQEWQLFLQVLLKNMGYDVDHLDILANDHSLLSTQYETPVRPKKKKECDEGSHADWKNMWQFKYHLEFYSDFKSLNLMKSSVPKFESEKNEDRHINNSAPLYNDFQWILLCLHLLYEDVKLDTRWSGELPKLVELLHLLASDLGFSNYVYHYWKDYPKICKKSDKSDSKIFFGNEMSTISDELVKNVPNIFDTIERIIEKDDSVRYPHVFNVNEKSAETIQFLTFLYFGDENATDKIMPLKCKGPESIADYESSVAYLLSKFPNRYNRVEKCLMLMDEKGWTQPYIDSFPLSVGWIFNDIIHNCRELPPEDWNSSQFELATRVDLSLASGIPMPDYVTPQTSDKGVDGMEGIEQGITRMIWRDDLRIKDVRRMLNSTTPLRISATKRPDHTPVTFAEEEERILFGISARTLALPIARGMYTYQTSNVQNTSTAHIPDININGISVTNKNTITLSQEPPVLHNMLLWPTFHNGVAAGLRLCSSDVEIDSAWILFNRHTTIGSELPDHAGFLLSMGLTGHLKKMHKMNWFDYLIKSHSMTSIAVLLGLSACYIGKMDVNVTKSLSVHIESLLPPTSLDLDVDRNVRTAALLGIGLNFQRTAHRHMAEVLLSEMGRSPGPEMDSGLDRESYTLAAGIGLGLILLGTGGEAAGFNDLNLSDALLYYMAGGDKVTQFDPKLKWQNGATETKLANYHVREGEEVNVDVTSPGATLALALIYLKTGNKEIADYIAIPETQYILDFICPDFMMLRIIARGLIMWDESVPTMEWVEGQIPSSIRDFCLVKPKFNAMNDDNIDYETTNQAYCNIVAGACMVLGMKYAGSNDEDAIEIIHHYCRMFVSLLGRTFSELAGKSTLENTINVTILALGLVTAGTGNVEVMRICEMLRSRPIAKSNNVVTYGSYMAAHMALGLTFLGAGRYSLSTGLDAIAAMIIAFYPKFPTHTNDNRYHLQAFRHFYVLAVEPRLIMPREINGGLVYAKITYLVSPPSWKKNNSKDPLRKNQLAPCILPEAKYLLEVAVDDLRYWPVVYKREKNFDQYEKMLKKRLCLPVKKKLGRVIYDDDPHGYKCLHGHAMVPLDCVPWFAKTDILMELLNDQPVYEIISEFVSVIRQNQSKRCASPESKRPSSDDTNMDVEDSVECDQMMDICNEEKRLKKLYEEKIVDGRDIDNRLRKMYANILYECVLHDKLYAMPLWIETLKALKDVLVYADSRSAKQLKVFIAGRRKDILDSNAGQEDSTPIVTPSTLAAFNHLFQIITDKWLKETEVRMETKSLGEENNDIDLNSMESFKATINGLSSNKENLGLSDTENPVTFLERTGVKLSYSEVCKLSNGESL